MSKITLIRKNKPSWTFTWNETYNGYIYKTRHNTYKIFFDNCTEKSKYDFEPDIWIGRLAIQNNEKFWYTCEKAIKAQSLIMFRGQYNFN